MKIRHKTYCSKCFYTLWAGERAVFKGSNKFEHRDCLEALKDSTPRILHPKWEEIVGKVNKRKLREKLEDRLSQQAGPALTLPSVGQ